MPKPSRNPTSGSSLSTRTRIRPRRSRAISPSCGASSEASLAELLMIEAINDAFHTELARDDSVLVMGEDVGRSRGVFRSTAGLRDRFAPDRCVDTPLAEAGVLGSPLR